MSILVIYSYERKYSETYWLCTHLGVSMNVQPMYLGESAPKELQGAVAMTSVIFTALGIVIGQVVGLR